MFRRPQVPTPEQIRNRLRHEIRHSVIRARKAGFAKHEVNAIVAQANADWSWFGQDETTEIGWTK